MGVRTTANETVVIDIMARFVDQSSENLDEINQKIRSMGNAFQKPKAEADKLGASLEKTRQQANKLTRDKWSMKLDVIDKATSTIRGISSSVYGFAGKTFRFGVKVLDYATKPLRGIFNFATSIQGVLTGLIAGQAAQTLVSQPIGLSDSYSNAYIGFKTLFRDEEQAQKMMDDLDRFAKETPFKTSNVISQSQKMLAMGWDAGSLLKDMETIGNAASATGRGDEGLDRIVLALAQIKSKGKLSTEELNQLAEAGINAKAYIAQGLGYGRSDEGLQMLASDLQKGAIGGNAAVEMILAGMKEYDGMMQTLSKETASGIRSNIEDTFEISIIRKWGKGLQEGAIKGLGTFADFLDKNEDKLNRLGDTAQAVASKLSNQFADAAKFVTEKILEVTDSEGFQNADFGGKIKILWDEVIGKPFGDWWSKNSQGMAETIGGGLGRGLRSMITGIFGIDTNGIAGEAASFGGSFAKSFLEGFQAEEVGKAVWNGLKNAFDNAPGWAKTLVAGLAVKKGADLAVPAIQTGTSLVRGGMGMWETAKGWLSNGKGGAGLAGEMPQLGKVLKEPLSDALEDAVQTVSPVDLKGAMKDFRSAANVRKSAQETLDAAEIALKKKRSDFSKLYTDYTLAQKVGMEESALKAMEQQLDLRQYDLVRTANDIKDLEAAKSLADNHYLKARQGFSSAKEAAKGGGGLATAGTTIAGGAKAAGATGQAAGAVGLSGTAAAAITVGGWIVGALGLVDAGKDIAEGFESKSKKQSQDKYVTGAAKAGMVASGAGIGALIGSIIPGIGTAVGAAVGAAIGGVGAMTGGDSLGQWISDSLDGTRQIREAANSLITSRDELYQSVRKDTSANALIDEYERLQKLLNDSKTPVAERKQLETEVKAVVQELSSLYPGLISQQDVLNGRVSTNLDTLREISALERERARWDLEKEIKDARNTFEKKDVAGKLEKSDQELAENKAGAERIQKAIGDAAPLMAEYDALKLKAELNPDYVFTADYEQEINGLRERINEVAGEAGFRYDGDLTPFRTDFAEDAGQKREQYIEAIYQEQARNDELRETYNELFLAEKALIENNAGLNGSIEDAAGSFDKLDAAQRDALKEAIEQVIELQKEFDNLPRELQIPVQIIEGYGWLRYGAGTVWEESLSYRNEEYSSPSGKSYAKYASGGIVTRPHMGLVGEAGPEAIIPLSGSRRSRGMSLWEETGRALGVMPYADGGMAGSQSYLPQTVRYSGDNAAAAGVSINMGGLNFNFEGVDAGNPDSIIQAIRAQMPQIANELCRMIANALPKSFGNMA